MIFPDYTAAVQQQRSSFTAVKRKLRELKLKYALLFPDKLRVEAFEKIFFFDNPKEAWDWAEKSEDDPEAARVEGWERRPQRRRRMRLGRKTSGETRPA